MEIVISSKKRGRSYSYAGPKVKQSAEGHMLGKTLVVGASMALEMAGEMRVLKKTES